MKTDADYLNYYYLFAKYGFNYPIYEIEVVLSIQSNEIEVGMTLTICLQKNCFSYPIYKIEVVFSIQSNEIEVGIINNYLFVKK